ncbi:MAG: winged helix-turn-helix domain-containing protein [Alphaproteobacteria bacterium]|nr:winged helix-turn-helix domain-containing protein [Alphaproteobacteria bacterium]
MPGLWPDCTGNGRVHEVGSAESFLFEGFRLDLGVGVLYRLGEMGDPAVPVALGPRTISLLGLLAARQGEVISKDAIIRAVWPGRVVEEANLNVQVSKLRQVLDQNPAQGSCIRTIPGRGYCFVAPVTRPGADAEPSSSTVADLVAEPRQRLSIVVVPFDNLSHDPSQRYLADGITEDLTINLSRFTDLLVISRNTAFTYREQPRDTKQIGRELGVRYLLEGSVRRSGTRVRVNAQLVDAEADAHLWAERFDRHLLDLLDWQDEVAAAIAGAIEPELLKSERNCVARRPIHTEDAYEFYQRGLWHFYRYTKEDSVQAQAFFRRALAIDPQYPQPTAQLAITLCNASYLGWVADSERNYREAYEFAQRAVSLDARYPAAHFALGLVCMWTQRSDIAMSAFQEAINLNPSYAAAHVLLGQMHLYRGEPEKAITLAEKGIRLSPKHPRLFIWLAALSGAHYQLHHYAQAIEVGRRSWMLNRNWPAGLRYAVAGLARLGRIEDAKTALEELKLLNPNLAFIAGNLNRLYDDDASVEHIVDGLRAAGLD